MRRYLTIGIITLSLILPKAYAEYRDEDIKVVSAGCEAAVGMIVAAAIAFSGGSTAVGAAFGTGTLTFSDEACNDQTAISLLDYATKTYENSDSEAFLEENCGGTLGNCDDPLLNPISCGPYEVCPESPLDCMFPVQCMNGMLKMSENGFSANDVFNSVNYMNNARNNGIWAHQESSFGGGGNSLIMQ